MVRFAPISLVTLAVAALLGCSVVQAAPWLPAWKVCVVTGVVCLVLLCRARAGPVRHLASMLMFAAWAAAHGARGVDARLPVDREGRDVLVTGRVIELPRRLGNDASFFFAVESADALPALVGQRVRLTWFRPAAFPQSCERWRLTVRLKRPRGSLNPGGNDSERTALQQRLSAVGYVRANDTNASLPAGGCVDGWRASLSRRMDAALGPQRARIVKALTVGDTRGLDGADWDVARSTGVSHLIAISGFHVGVAAGAGLLLVRLLYAMVPPLALRVPRPVAQALAGMVVAGTYGLLAGMGLPTVRSLLMIAVVVMATLCRRRVDAGPLLGFALLAVMVAAPLSVLSAGFWLSFAGVGFLMLCVAPRGQGWRGRLGELLRVQAAMSLVLLPMSLWWFGTASLVGFATNLVAAPLVSFVVVPLCLLGCCLLPWPCASEPVLGVAAWVLSCLWDGLAHAAGWPGARVGVVDGGLVPILLATLGAAWLFVPRGVPLRGYGAVLFLPLVFPQRDEPAVGGFRAWVLDVGQGLSVLVHTRHHTLVYDAGPAYAAGRDAGAGTVLPAITALGIGPVDTLVVSHGDVDHAGGAASVAARYPQASRLSGEPKRLTFDAERCQAGASWSWDGVTFRFLSVPRERGGKTKANDRSCVLAVEGEAGRLLLTGDIGDRAERRMDADELASSLPTVTTVAHHGSRHASDARWLKTVAPVLSIASAGWRNRFGHPHADVIRRHEAVGAALRVTATSGALEVDVPADGDPHVGREWRRASDRYWRER